MLFASQKLPPRQPSSRSLSAVRAAFAVGSSEVRPRGRHRVRRLGLPRRTHRGDARFSFELPLGISFITFTLAALLIDVARFRFPARYSLASVTAYAVFFPHSIAGPILRPHELLPQIDNPRHIGLNQLKIGACLFAWGLFKKLAGADTFSPWVDRIYHATPAVGGWEAWTALYAFSLQIYCDFSGYTDMAIGLAALLGYRLPQNFHSPYGAASFVEFWRRWHVTLSRWLRDYLYIPLGGNRSGTRATYRNLMATMLLGGLWHGASWTFFAWGGVHGLALVANHALAGRPILRATPRPIRVLVTFHVVSLAWIFFRAPDFSTALRMFKSLAGFASGPGALELVRANGVFFLMFGFFFAIHALDDVRRVRIFALRSPAALTWTLCAMVLLTAMAFGVGGTTTFVYFQF